MPSESSGHGSVDANLTCRIIRERRRQANFQLIVITHDEGFLQRLAAHDVLEYYWCVQIALLNDRSLPLIQESVEGRVTEVSAGAPASRFLSAGKHVYRYDDLRERTLRCECTGIYDDVWYGMEWLLRPVAGPAEDVYYPFQAYTVLFIESREHRRVEIQHTDRRAPVPHVERHYNL